MQTLNKAHQLTDLEKVRKITKLIRYGEKRLKRKFSFLENQNTIGLCIFKGISKNSKKMYLEEKKIVYRNKIFIK